MNVNYSKEIALNKLKHYCAYQDRSHREVRTKLLKLEVYGDDLEEIMSDLIKEKYLDESRFACSFARGKFRMKKWGRIKIKQHLKQHDISDYCMRKAMKEIDAEEYYNTLSDIIDKKMIDYSDLNEFKRKQKLISYCISRGYEMNLILEIVKDKT
jgi:regulatory protein